MTRNQLSNVYNTATSNSNQFKNDAGTAFNQTEQGLSDFEKGLSDFKAADPYKAGGEFATDEATINASRANADSGALGNELNLVSKRTGENTAGYKNTLEQGTAAATRDEATAQAQSDAQRLANETSYNQFGVNASEFPVTANENLFSTSGGLANSALNTGETAAANNQSFGDVFGENFASSLGKGLGSLATGGAGGGGGTNGGQVVAVPSQTGAPSVIPQVSAEEPDATAGTGVVGAIPGVNVAPTPTSAINMDPEEWDSIFAQGGAAAA